MTKSDGTQYGGVLEMLDMLLYDVFAAMVARVYESNWGPSAGGRPGVARRQPTVAAPRASSRVRVATHAPAEVGLRRPRTA